MASKRRPTGDPLLRAKSRAGGPFRIGVVDLGSTSFHLLVAEATRDGRLRRVARRREMLRLGAELAHSRRISHEVIERAINASARLRAFAEREKVERMVAVGTSALRDAANARELRAGISAALGVPVRVLSGREEARIIFSAICKRMGLGNEVSLGLDLGGGSLEFALGSARGVSWESTLPLGVTRLHAQFISEDRSGRIALAQLDQVRARVHSLVRPLRARVKAAAPERAVAVGGSVRALARLVSEGSFSDSELTGIELTRERLDALSEALARDTHAQRLRRRGMSARRADLLPVGAAALAAALATLGIARLTCCDWGLREGIAIELLAPSQRRIPIRATRIT
jgi:exopolyphosphatase/guanosine-5'-triphosphate,3'-diphosphate pyrophosphatase